MANEAQSWRPLWALRERNSQDDPLPLASAVIKNEKETGSTVAVVKKEEASTVAVVKKEEASTVAVVKEEEAAAAVVVPVVKKEEVAPTPKPPPADGLMIGGVRIRFPAGKKPFPPQISVMSKAISALSKGENALLESPTGTGKTLALLTASLSWQKEQHDKAWVEYAALYGEDVAVRARADAESQSDDYSRATPLEDKKESPPPPPPPPKKKQIFYMSRTHTQLKQVIQQLRSMHPSLSSNVRMTLLGSKDHLCTNDHARNFRETMTDCASLDDACTALRKSRSCRSYRQVDLAMQALRFEIHDIEDSVAVGKHLTSCPYYATRELSKTADIVFCPYNYLLDLSIKKSTGIDVNDCVLVIDEGHNIADVCREGSTVAFTVKKIDEAARQLKRLAGRAEFYSKMQVVMQGLADWLRRKVLLIQGVPPMNQSSSQSRPASELPNVLHPLDVVRDFEKELGLTRDSLAVYSSMLQEIIVELRENGAELMLIGSDDDEDSQKTQTQTQAAPGEDKEKTLNVATCKLIEGFLGVCELLLRQQTGGGGGGEFLHHDDYKVVIDCDDGSGDFRGGGGGGGWGGAGRTIATPDPKLTFLCLNAAVGFREIAKGVHSILVTSGTLSPLLSFAGELGTAFDHNVEAKHVIASRQLLVGAVGAFGHQSLESTYKAQQSFTYQDAVLHLILAASSTVPARAGTLVFFPSYGMLDKLHARWRTTGQLQLLTDSRDVFIEPRSARDCDQVLRAYLGALDGMGGSGNGAVLLCVCRGKVSEGLDFSDDKARLVLIVGIPYPPAFDVAVRLKREYQDVVSRKAAAAGAAAGAVENGSQWYDSQAWRAINQAVGRCIRHRLDWGCLLFLDPRFKQPRNKAVLSKWVRDEVRDFDNYQAMHLELKLFMSDLSNNPPGGHAPVSASVPVSLPAAVPVSVAGPTLMAASRAAASAAGMPRLMLEALPEPQRPPFGPFSSNPQHHRASSSGAVAPAPSAEQVAAAEAKRTFFNPRPRPEPASEVAEPKDQGKGPQRKKARKKRS